MITKGIVEELKGYQAKVRLPIYDGLANTKNATSNENLSYATVCVTTNLNNSLDVGDIVYVSFEDNDKGKPVILGQLYKEEMNTLADIKLNSANINQLTVNKNASLPQNTSIGSISSKEIAALSGIKDNIQNQIDINLPAINFAESERQKSKNLFNGNWHYNYGMTVEGYLGENSNENTSYFIEVTPNATYTISGVSFKYVAEYTSNDESSFVKLSYSSTFTTSATTHYIRFTIDNSVSYTNAQLEEGLVATSFQKFNGIITHNGDAPVVFAESERQKSKNLFYYTKHLLKNKTGLTLTHDLDTQSFSINGTSTDSGNWITNDGLEQITLKASMPYTLSSYKVSGNIVNDDYAQAYIYFTDGTYQHVDIRDGQKTFILDSDKILNVITFDLSSSNTYNNYIFHLQVEEGISKTEWSPYNGAIVHEKEIQDVEHIETIYDMSDSNKNIIDGVAYTSGLLINNNSYIIDFTKYKRVYVISSNRNVPVVSVVDLTTKTNDTFYYASGGMSYNPITGDSNQYYLFLGVHIGINKNFIGLIKDGYNTTVENGQHSVIKIIGVY